jgi:hypothetical protein
MTKDDFDAVARRVDRALATGQAPHNLVSDGLSTVETRLAQQRIGLLWLGLLVVAVAVTVGLSQAYFIGRLGSVEMKIDATAEETRVALAAIQAENRESSRTLSAALASTLQEMNRQPSVIVVPAQQPQAAAPSRVHPVPKAKVCRPCSVKPPKTQSAPR